MLKNWIKIFLYQIKNNKLFTALNVMGLSLGIAGLIFAILYWNEEHEYNDWNTEKENVFLVINDMSGKIYWNTNVAPFDDYFKTFPEVENHCYFNNWYGNQIMVYKGKKVLIEKITDAQNTFFSNFPFDFIEGNSTTALKDNTSIAISQKTAQSLFGNQKALGKEIQYGGKTLVVRGVYTIPGKSSLAPMAVTNFIDERLKENKEEDNWGNFSYGLMIKLKDPNQAEEVKKKMQDLYFEHRTKAWAKEEGMTPTEYEKKNPTPKIVLEQLKTVRLHSVTTGFPEGTGNYQFLMIMVWLSVLILILSIVNYVNLATANAIKRAKEVGVRKIIGASKTNIIRQFVFETIILAGFSIFLSLVIVELTLPYYNDFLNKTLQVQSGQLIAQLAVVFVVVVAVAGIFPAIYVANFEALNVLKGNFSRSKNGIWLRNGMLILQFGIASFFIIGSYIVYQQVEYMSNKEIGFTGSQVIEIYYRRPDANEGKKIFNRYETIKQELSKIKGVEGVSAGAFSFGFGVSSSSSFQYNNNSNIQAQNMAVDFEMLDMMKIKMFKGRNLSSQFASDTINTMLINKESMRLMNEKEPIGKEIKWNGETLKIVGVVDDFSIYGPQHETPPMVFFHFKTIDWMSFNLNKIFVKVDPNAMEQTLSDIEKFWLKNVNADYPFEYGFVDKNFARTYQTYIKQRNLFGLLNGLVIVIALFGLFALASYSIERRMKEIAIRKTLGAETGTLLKELSKQYVVFCIIGFILALFPVYYLLSKWLENFAYRITISWIPFVVGFVILLLLTLIVVLSRAFLATRVDVLRYLKYE